MAMPVYDPEKHQLAVTFAPTRDDIVWFRDATTTVRGHIVHVGPDGEPGDGALDRGSLAFKSTPSEADYVVAAATSLKQAVVVLRPKATLVPKAKRAKPKETTEMITIVDVDLHVAGKGAVVDVPATIKQCLLAMKLFDPDCRKMNGAPPYKLTVANLPVPPGKGSGLWMYDGGTAPVGFESMSLLLEHVKHNYHVDIAHELRTNPSRLGFECVLDADVY